MDMEGDILEMNTSCRIAFGAYIGSLDFLSASGVTDLPSTIDDEERCARTINLMIRAGPDLWNSMQYFISCLLKIDGV